MTDEARRSNSGSLRFVFQKTASALSLQTRRGRRVYVNDTGTVGQASLSGAYSVASNGRVSGSFTENGVALPFSMYLISPSQGYYLDERTSAVGGGNVYAQSASVTSNADWAGSYATKQFGCWHHMKGLSP